MYFILFLLPALAVSFWGYYTTRGNHWRNRVSGKEFFISMAMNVVLAGLCVGANQLYINSQFGDSYYVTEKVIDKTRDKVSCSHSYSCNCVTTCNGKSCTTICQTCYDHSYDVDWNVKSNVGSTTIHRIDRQGLKEPPRWSNVIIGEPYTVELPFNNYLLADKDSLFSSSGRPTSLKHPEVFDYYRYKPSYGTSVSESEMILNWSVGKRIQPLVIKTVGKTPEYFDNVMASLVGGKINDVVLVYSVDISDAVQWMKVGTYAKGYKNSMMISSMENTVLDKPKFTGEKVVEALEIANSMFTKVDVKEFEEKKELVEIPLWLTIFMLTLNLIASIIIHIKMKQETL